MSEHQSHDIAGVEVCTNVPDGAVVTDAIVLIAYQIVDDDGTSRAGNCWGTSVALTMDKAVGMSRIAARQIELYASSDGEVTGP